MCDAFLEACSALARSEHGYRHGHDGSDAGAHTAEQAEGEARERAQLQSIRDRLGAVRKAVLFSGIRHEKKKRLGTSLRGRVWKIMLAVDQVPASVYLDLVRRKESYVYGKIRGDSFRTFRWDKVRASTSTGHLDPVCYSYV